MRQRISRCLQLHSPSRTASGSARLAEKRDAPILSRFLVEFHRDVGSDAPPDGPDATVQRIIDKGTATVWDDAGRVVACTNCARETRRGAVVTFVYTPPDERGKGYAQSLVSAVTQQHLAAGKQFCALFSDRDKPIPNHVYRKLGYEPVCDMEWWSFVDHAT